LVACSALGIWISAQGANITWVNANGGNWNVSTNWSPAQVPGSADTALITTSGNYLINVNGDTRIGNLVLGAASGTQSLTITGNTLGVTNATVGANGILNSSGATLSGFFTVSGTLNCNGATLGPGSTLTVLSNGVLNLSGSGTEYFYATLTNAGTVNWSGTANLRFYNFGPSGYTGGVVNQAGALFNVQNDQTMDSNQGLPIFSNAGTFQKSAGTNTTINVIFNNSGAMNVSSGTVTFNGSGTDNGTVTGTGNVSVTGGTMTINGAVPNLVLAGGTVTGANGSFANLTWSSGTLQGTNIVTGLASWTGGTLGVGAVLTIASNAVLNISGSAAKYLFGLLVNAGTINWSGTGYLQLYFYAPSGYTGGILNQAGALFNVQNDQTISSGQGTPIFNNAGTFVKSAGTNTTISVVFNNSGVLNLASGTVTFNGGGTDNGTVTGTGSLSVTSGPLTINGTVPNLILAGGTVTSVNGSFGNLTWSSGTLQGTNTVTELASWSGGTLGVGGVLTIASNAVLNISGSAAKYLFGLLVNAGTINWSGTGYLQLYFYAPSGYTGGILNQAGALFNVQNDQTISSGQGTPIFNNAGTFVKSAGTNTTISVVFNNSGVLNLASGTVTFNGGGTDNGTVTGTGSLSVTSGPLTINGTVPNLILAGGTVTSVNGSFGNLTWSSGTLQGTNTVTGLASWNGGTLGVGGLLTIASNAVLNISGSASEYLFGLLVNAGTVNWAGTGNIQLYLYAPSGYTGGILNQAGALFNVQNDQTISSGQGTPIFNNAGTFVKSAGTNTTISVVFNNSGVLNVASGTVTFNGGGTDNGTFTGSGNVSVTSGTLTLNGVAANLILAGGALNGVNASIGNLTWSSGTLLGTNTITGSASWTSGSLGAGSALTIATNAILNITGNASKSLSGVLTNAGTVNWSGTGDLLIYHYAPQGSSGGIVNLSGALFNAQNDQTIVGEDSASYFNNAGTFLKSALTNSTTLNLLFNNSGVLNVASGTVTFYGGGTNNGTVTGPGNISVNGGTLTPNGAVPNLILAGGTVNGVNASIGNLTWSSGTLLGTNTVTGSASWTSGSLGAGSALTIAANAILNINGNASKSLSGVLTNAGTVNWSGTGDLLIYHYALQGSSGGIVNLAGALFNAQNDQTIVGEDSASYFNNAGTLLKSAGTNTTLNLIFNNTGILNLSINSRSSFGRINLAGNVVLAGVVNVNFNAAYSPATGDSFALLTYGSESGVFSSVNLPGSAAWQTNSIIYGPTAFTVAIGSIYRLAFTPGPAATNSAGTVFTPPVVVQVQNLDGTALATNNVPIAIVLSSGSGLLSGTTTQNTDATGKATFTNLSLNLVGQKTLQASSPPWITPVSSLVTITSGPAAQLRLTTSIASLQKVGYAFSPAPTVQVLDAFGNIVSNATVLISANSVSSGGGVLGGTTGINANGLNGSAGFTNLHFGLNDPNRSETVTVYFTSPGLLPVTNGPVTVLFVPGLLTLTNGNSMVQIDPNSQDGVSAWNVDGTSQLFQHWFWLRKEPNSAQSSFDQLGTPLGLSWTLTNATIDYLPPGLNVMLSFTLQGGAVGSRASSLAESISIQNTTSNSITLHVYDYADFDLGGTNTGDTVSFPTNNVAVQRGKGMTATLSVQGQTPSFREASWYAMTLDEIDSVTPTILSNQINPVAAGDQTFAYQWDATLGAGQTFVLNLSNSIQSDSVRLTIALPGGNVQVSWPTSGTDSLKLQSSSSLNAGSVWADVTSPRTTIGANYQVTIPLTGQTQFYRLH
jgi:lipopolysaccharide export system protein LptA